jgi:hypothetical protein
MVAALDAEMWPKFTFAKRLAAPLGGCASTKTAWVPTCAPTSAIGTKCGCRVTALMTVTCYWTLEARAYLESAAHPIKDPNRDPQSQVPESSYADLSQLRTHAPQQTESGARRLTLHFLGG